MLKDIVKEDMKNWSFSGISPTILLIIEDET